MSKAKHTYFHAAKCSYLLALIGLMTLMASCIRDTEITYPNTPAGNLEALWTIIDEKYCYIDEKGLDWDGVLAEYLPQAEQLETGDYRALFDLMAQMLDTLQDGHVNLYSSFDISRCSGWYDGYPENFDSDLLTQYIGSDYKIAGGLTYNKIIGHENIGYVRYSSFSNGFSSANLYYIFSYFKDCKGLILDVRNNGGGSLVYSYQLCSAFMEQSTLIGYWHHKTGPGHDDFSELEEIWVDSTDMTVKWLRPVMVLCNRNSYSATNTFVSGMRYAPKCTIIGGKTGGGGGMPMSYELPNGWMVRFSSVRMLDREKVSIEPGIEPDIQVDITSEDKDNIIEKAISEINKKLK